MNTLIIITFIRLYLLATVHMKKIIILRSNHEYDYFGIVIEYEYDYFPSYLNTSTSTQKVLVLEYEYKYTSTITPSLVYTVTVYSCVLSPHDTVTRSSFKCHTCIILEI